VENVCSDIYCFLLVYLLQNKPFTNSALGEYEKQKTSFLKVTTSNIVMASPGKLIASPNLHSKFSPSIAISKSPVMTASTAFKIDGKEESKNFLMKVAGIGKAPEDLPRRGELKAKTVEPNNEVSVNLVGPNIPVNRKIRNNLKNIEEIKPRTQEIKSDYEDLPITPAAKVSNPNIEPMDVDDDGDFDDSNNDIRYEGSLYKIADDKNIKRLWFKLVNRDLYCKT
jgi:hypothetical protein